MEEYDLSDFPLWSDPETNKVFNDLCKEKSISPQVIQDLLAIIRQYQGAERARGIYEQIDDILSDDGV